MSRNKTIRFESLIKEVVRYKKEITSLSGKWETYDEWFGQSKHRGMASTYANYVNSAAVRYNTQNKGEKTKQEFKGKQKEIYDNFELYAKKFIEVAKDYLASIPDKTSPLDDKKWFFYCLSVPQDRSKHLKIARAVLTTEDKNSVRIKNVEDGFSVDYEGEYRVLEGRNVAYFNFLNSKKSPTRHLHVKITYLDPDNELIFGVYTTYDEQVVYSGLVVLERLTTDKLIKYGQDPPAIICSYKHKRTEFKKINKLIVRYLSDKRKNYIGVRKITPTFDQLKINLDSYKLLSNNHNRFLELETPRLYLAIAQGAALESNDPSKDSPADLKTLVKEIKEKLEASKEKVEFISKLSPDEQSTAFKSEDSLKLIQTTRYFVIILSEVNKASFSLIQLGWALAYAKYVLVISKVGSVSDRIKSLPGKTVKQIEYNSLKSEKDRSLIQRAIQDLLKTDMEQ